MNENTRRGKRWKGIIFMKVYVRCILHSKLDESIFPGREVLRMRDSVGHVPRSVHTFRSTFSSYSSVCFIGGYIFSYTGIEYRDFCNCFSRSNPAKLPKAKKYWSTRRIWRMEKNNKIVDWRFWEYRITNVWKYTQHICIIIPRTTKIHIHT